MEKHLIYPQILMLLGNQANAMVDWDSQDPEVVRLVEQYRAEQQANQVREEFHFLRQPEPGEVFDLTTSQNLASFEDPDFGFFNFIFDGDDEEQQNETEGETKFAESSYLTEIFAPLGNPGDPPQKKQKPNNIFTDMAELVPDENANFMFEQPQSKNALLRAVHGFLANNSISGMDMEHKGISEVDFHNAKFSDDVQLPGSQAFDLQHEDLFKLMTEHVTQKNAILEAHLEAERAGKSKELVEEEQAEAGFNFDQWRQDYQMKGLEQELEEQKRPKKKQEQPVLRFKPAAMLLEHQYL